MKKAAWILTASLLGLMLLLGAGHLAMAQDSEAKEIESLAKEYAEMRARMNTVAPGVFDRELQGSGGRFGKVIAELGERLGTGKYRREDILRIMGTPDATLEAGAYQPGSPGYESGAIPEGTTHLVYFWRGWHDYLYFVCEGETVTRAAWYAALE